ncbi:transporter [Plakobranchus ocellatus]|uniref:Transporter n=1 Tax=Plakobranchus ocellatus TaxID=259542 RepID=A0AAV4BSK8_9GAST|nr:transporter [Plakobranchus ocellatus]
MSLEKRVQALQDDLFAAQDELQAFQDRYDEVVHESEDAKDEVRHLREQVSNLKAESQRQARSRSRSRSPPSSRHEEDLETSLISTTTKLQETLNELNLVKSQLCQNQQDLATSRVDIGNSRQEVDLLKQSLEMATKHLDESEDELQTYKQELAHTQETLEVTKAQLKERQAKLDAVVAERDEIQRDLDTMYDEQQMRVTPRPLDPALYGSEEREEHVGRISTLEKLSRQLELDNREMARKLADTMAKSESLEEQLGREKLRHTDKYQHSSRYTEQLEHDMDSANKHIRQLREELQQQHTKNFKLEADNLGLSAKYESTISRLEQDIKDLKHRHRQELDSLSERMEASSSEARDMRSQKRDVDQELTRLRQEVSHLKSDKEQLENHLQAESKIKLDLQNRNSVMDNEMTKVWSQVRSLMEKNADLESTNRNQGQDNTMKETKLRQVEAALSQKEATYEASTKALVLRAETAENKCKSLQRELEEVTRKLVQVESQLTQADTGRLQLEDSRDKLVAIRNQLEGEKLQRTLLDQTVAELKHQVALLKQRESKVTTENKDLQHTILDLESRLNELKDTTAKVNFDTQPHHKATDVGTRSLMDQIARLQREVKELQFELYNVSERRDVDVKRYEERKHRTKAKLMKAREFYTNERSKYMDHMKHLDEDLRLTRATLTKELEWREKMDDNYKTLMREKRDLISQLAEGGEKLRDRSRALSMAQVRIQYLEEETSGLQARLQNVTQQKQGLEKLLREQGRREKLRMASPTTEQHTSGTSGLGNSLDSRWGSCDRLDSLNHSHSWGGSGVRVGSSLGRPVTSGRGAGSGSAGDLRDGREDKYDDREQDYDGEVNVRGSVDSGRDRIVLSNNVRNSEIINNNTSDQIKNSAGSGMSLRMSADAGVVIIPQEHDDYAMYTEIDDVRRHDDNFYDDGDEFHA